MRRGYYWIIFPADRPNAVGRHHDSLFMQELLGRELKRKEGET